MPCGPEPVFGKGFLQAGQHWAADLYVGIAPRRQFGVASQVLIANVVPTDEALQAVDDDDLAVVAEVDLEAIEPAVTGAEGTYLNAAFTQRLAVCRG